MTNISENISVTNLAKLLLALGTIVGAIITIDNRYVHAEDFKSQMTQVRESITDLHRARLEDEIYRLELIPEQKRTQQDRALLERYKNQLKEIDSKRRRE